MPPKPEEKEEEEEILAEEKGLPDGSDKATPTAPHEDDIIIEDSDLESFPCGMNHIKALSLEGGWGACL